MSELDTLATADPFASTGPAESSVGAPAFPDAELAQQLPALLQGETGPAVVSPEYQPGAANVWGAQDGVPGAANIWGDDSFW